MRRYVGLALLLAAISGGVVWAVESDLESRFKKRCLEIDAKRVAGNGDKVFGADTWVLVASELKHAARGPFWGSNATPPTARVKPEHADPTPAIVDFHQQLSERGIELIFLPVPVRPLIYPESVLGALDLPEGSSMPHLNPAQDEFFQILRRQGVHVVDMTRPFLDQRDDPLRPLYLRSDPHWSGVAVTLVGKVLAEMLRTRPWYKDVEKSEFVAEWITKAHTGGTYRRLKERPAYLPENETVQLRQVKTASGESLELRNPGSPVILIGDSNAIWWNQYEAGLPDQLALELGFQVDALTTHGNGATGTRLNLIRNAQASPGLLDTTRVVIWCLTARSLTTSSEGWIKTPLQPPAPKETTADPAGKS